MPLPSSRRQRPLRQRQRRRQRQRQLRKERLVRRLLVPMVVLVLFVPPHRAEAQGHGQGRPKNPQASSESGSTATAVSTSQFRQFGVWLDDATTRAKGGGTVGLGIGYWRGA